MGLLDKAKKLASKENVEKAKGLVADNADKISGTVSKATDKIDEKTKGKHRDKLDKVEEAVDSALEKTKPDDGPETPGPTTERP